ncbi:hypothetical protein H1O16_gp030 [Burkholderia phage BcepSaruman]|uniref:Uncharacterized protein n=1 Tax=Burkholderia phage BcepSaruman TaxID=2530032 RepID=A0A4D5ZBS1_9CAUD|nr:hypothetical protein H1O16_gp030 [Burkholderia phage BcepSaruman]QBX06443.1 hypothetical protein BcepSaruman_030 [Burkholderia phage BcepSaruman]
MKPGVGKWARRAALVVVVCMLANGAGIAGEGANAVYVGMHVIRACVSGFVQGLKRGYRAGKEGRVISPLAPQDKD